MLMGNMIGIHQQTGVISAYTAMPPEDMQCHGAVLLLHDIWGLTDHIKSVADRLAKTGYYVMAPELLFMTPEKRASATEMHKGLVSVEPQERNEAMRKFQTLLNSTQTPQFESLTLSRLEACFAYVYNQPFVRQKVAVMGFGFGGTYTFALAVRNSRLKAAVPFYGHAGYHELELRHITCPILAFYGGQDNLAREVSVLTPRMAHVGVRYTPVTYDTAGPSFFNDSNSGTYDRTSAEDAWHRLVSFLRLSFIS